MQAYFHALAYVAPMTYGTRLAEAIKLAKSSRKALGTALHITEQSVGMVIRGETGAQTAENCAYAARFLRVSYFWLATGEGEARPNEAWPFLSFGAHEFFAVDEKIRQEVEDRLLGSIVRAAREPWKRRA